MTAAERRKTAGERRIGSQEKARSGGKTDPDPGEKGVGQKVDGGQKGRGHGATDGDGRQKVRDAGEKRGRERRIAAAAE
jgi:hypothetical protein